MSEQGPIGPPPPPLPPLPAGMQPGPPPPLPAGAQIDAGVQAVVDSLQNATNAFTQLLGHLVANNNANAQAQVMPPVHPAGIPAPVVQPAQFLQTPMRAGINAVMDLASKGDRKYYETATKPLFDNNDKFNVEPSNFQTFINLLHVRARDLGMLEPGQCMMVPPDPNNPLVGVPINSITDYGRTTLEQVTAWESSFIFTNSHMSQNSKVMYDLLTNSLSQQGLQRTQVWKDQYQLRNQAGKYEDSGGCLFKVIVRESYLDSNATVNTIRTNLSMLDDYIMENGADLTGFNAYVQSQLDGLAARGEVTMDLVVNLFKAYAVVKDDHFQTYIQGILNSHNDGTAQITGPALMHKAVNFYKNAVTNKTWEAPSETKKQVLALTAKVAGLQKKKVKFMDKKPAAKPNQKSPRAKPEKPGWLKNHEKPKKDIRKWRMWNDIKWFWCSPDTNGKCEGSWRVHHPKDCKGITNPNKKKKVKFAGKKRKFEALKIQAANAAVAEEAEMEEVGEAEDEGEASDYE